MGLGYILPTKLPQRSTGSDNVRYYVLTLLVAGGGGGLSTPRVFLKYLPNGLS